MLGILTRHLHTICVSWLPWLSPTCSRPPQRHMEGGRRGCGQWDILTLFLFIHHAILHRYDFTNTNVKAVSRRLGIFEWWQKGWLKGQKNCPVSSGEVQERLKSLRRSTKFPRSICAQSLHFLGQLINMKVDGSKLWPCQSQGGKWRRWPRAGAKGWQMQRVGGLTQEGEEERRSDTKCPGQQTPAWKYTLEPQYWICNDN